MYIYYYAEFGYGDCSGPFNCFALDFAWLGGQNGTFYCNESVWMVPGTVED